MKYRNLVIALGFLTIIIQSLGFPQSFRDILYILVGASVIVFSYISGKEKKAKAPETSAPTSLKP